MARTPMRRTALVILLSICTIAVVGAFGAIVRQSWITNSATTDNVDLEAQGAAILHEMTSLLGELVEAQSTAVRGEAVDQESLRNTLAETAQLDQQFGVALQTRQRLSDLTAAIDNAITRAETGRAAYDTYTGLVTLAVDLIRRIGDTSHLIHDPDLDSYYLMEAAIIRLPDAIVLAGRATDLVTLAGGKKLEGEDAVRAAVARFGVSAAAEKVNDGLAKSVESTSLSTLGSSIAERLDAFKAAADAFAPPTMLAELAGTVEADVLAANARRVYAAANPLAHRLLGELQVLLDQRQAKLATEWRFTAIASTLAAVFGLVMLLLVFNRTRTGAADGVADRGSGAARLDDLPVGSMTYARELLEAEELVHLGRAVRARPRGNGDAR